ncbi:Mur ligase domain-containing protein [Streptomyces sp. NPDC006602]|uniref:Mur ligase domain-containing protein n=1 Tax=Streptomyces sp. NPDC006602 TaxID=3364751 RepID=UPI0036CD732C
MLAVARVCAERGFAVSGSDVRVSEQVEKLAGLGVAVHTGHAGRHVEPHGTEPVVHGGRRPRRPQ